MQQVKQTDNRRIIELDGLRGMAILLVLIWHYVPCQLKAEDGTLLHKFLKALNLTWSGVDLFFVLSGFLIGGILIDNKHSQNFLKVFYIRRFYRIVPLYFTWIILFALLYLFASSWFSPLLAHELLNTSIPGWSYPLFLQNFLMAKYASFGNTWLSSTWSLAVEEQFYLIFPFIVLFTSRRKMPYVFLAIILLAPVLRIFLFYTENGIWACHLLMPSRADALLFGALIAFLVRDVKLKKILSNNLRLIYFLFAVFGAVIILYLFKGWSFGSVNGSFAMASVGYSVLACFYTCFLVIGLIERKGVVTSILRNKLLGSLGGLAYGVYIFHQPVNYLVHGLFLKQVPQINNLVDAIATFSSFVLTILLAYLSWNYFEKAMVARGHAYRYKKPAEAKAVIMEEAVHV